MSVSRPKTGLRTRLFPGLYGYRGLNVGLLASQWVEAPKVAVRAWVPLVVEATDRGLRGTLIRGEQNGTAETAKST